MIGDLELPQDLCENIHKHIFYTRIIYIAMMTQSLRSIAGWVKSKPRDDGSKQQKYITVRASVHKDRKDGEQPIPSKPEQQTTTLDDLLS